MSDAPQARFKSAEDNGFSVLAVMSDEVCVSYGCPVGRMLTPPGV